MQPETGDHVKGIENDQMKKCINSKQIWLEYDPKLNKTFKNLNKDENNF